MNKIILAIFLAFGIAKVSDFTSEYFNNQREAASISEINEMTGANTTVQIIDMVEGFFLKAAEAPVIEVIDVNEESGFRADQRYVNFTITYAPIFWILLSIGSLLGFGKKSGYKSYPSYNNNSNEVKNLQKQVNELKSELNSVKKEKAPIYMMPEKVIMKLTEKFSLTFTNKETTFWGNFFWWMGYYLMAMTLHSLVIAGFVITKILTLPIYAINKRRAAVAA